MSPGPFRPFLDGLARIQANFHRDSPIRTALVTARGAPAHLRVVNTLRQWGVRVDETYFLGGVDKTDVLAAFGAHIFFDDQRSHAQRAARKVPAAQVLWPAEALGPVGTPGAPVVVRRRRRTKRATPAAGALRIALDGDRLADDARADDAVVPSPPVGRRPTG